jgi:outer membrane protein assembly factor BamE
MKNLASTLCKSILWISLSISLSACFIRPYKFDLIQGNVVTAAKIAEIHPGMSEDQVRDVLGTPMLHDVFHTQRWDYVYYEKPGYGEPIRQHIASYFDRGQVERVTRDPLPEVA